MTNTPTPHIAAGPEQLAKTVLMPGDPLRSAYIAEQFLENPVLVNNIRGVQGYTGTYRDVPVTVMASGMGMPSMGIYSYELFRMYPVEKIIRVGTAGGMALQVRPRDLVIGMGACTDSNYGSQFHLPGVFAPVADYGLLRTCVDTAKALGLERVHVGTIVSSDRFYNDEEDLPEAQRSTALWSKMGVLAVEMEAAALYMNAARAGKRALALFTVSDHLVTGEALSAIERQTSFTDMMRLALETAVEAEALA